jgi:CRISPR type I-D-associated protein Csc2
MYQIVVERELQGRGIFCTESRNEPNFAPTPTREGIRDLPVILGRKLAAKERRSLLKVRNALAEEYFSGEECHISPTTRGDGGIAGPCMQCPVCFLHGGLRSGDANYARAGIVLYDDAYVVDEPLIETLTLNAVDTKTQRTGTALATETFVVGGSFLNVVTLDHDAPEFLNLVLDSILATHSYGARSRHYGRMKNVVVGILPVQRPQVTAYGLVQSLAKGADGIRAAAGSASEWIDPPQLGKREELFIAAIENDAFKSWKDEAAGYLDLRGGG